MITVIAHILAWILSLGYPGHTVFYASGAWRGVDACVSQQHLPENGDRPVLNSQPPQAAADSAAVLTDDGHLWLASQNASKVQPIASITKLMTALVFLDHNPGWDKEYTIKKDDMVEGGMVHLFFGDKVRVKDLFNSSLVASDNGATLSLARSTGLSDEDFVTAMNKKASDLGLLSTNFVDPTGLSTSDVSDARDVARLAQAALDNKDIAKAVSQSEYVFKTLQGRKKTLVSTDWLLDSDSEDKRAEIVGGKTGYTDEAGYCFVGRFRDPEGRTVIAVVLNSGTKNDRFREARKLANWAFTYCRW